MPGNQVPAVNTATQRTRIYSAIDGERDYQDKKWGGPVHDRGHSITEYLVYMRDYIEQALRDETHLRDAEADIAALNNIRKVTALGVACMEVHGAPRRE